MAEGVVGSLLIKIGVALCGETAKVLCSFLTSESSALRSFFHEMRNISEELESIQGYLREAERFRETDENIRNFVRQIRGVAFDIEDIVDEFTYNLNEQNRVALTRLMKSIRRVKTCHKLTKRLTETKARLSVIGERKNRYETNGIKKVLPQVAGRWRTAEDEHFIKEDELVGVDVNKNRLMKLLNDENMQHKIISVCGMGGVGKTALVTHVYNKIKGSFDACAWISVSQTWERDQMLRKILLELRRESHGETIVDGVGIDYISLIHKIHEYLHNKRYLIIFDDVWSIDVWISMKNALPDHGIGRIVLTTRSHEVALVAPEQQMIEICPLKKHHSWHLFCKIAFQKNDNIICPEELIQWAEKVVNKCSGLPLAILAIGGLMSCLEQTEREWRRLCEELEHELEQNPNLSYVNRILQLSFDELPCYLKNCFMYLSIFPKDYQIERKVLTKLWISEGFIVNSEKRTMEQVAEDYLNELVRRCLLQDVKKTTCGRVIKCTVHDIIHNMAILKAKEENFCMVYSNSENADMGIVRRVSVQNCKFEQSSKNVSSLRSCLFINSSISSESLILLLKSSGFLRVLDLKDIPLKRAPNEVFNLFNLHYLGLEGSGIEEIPKSIGLLKNLQFLVASETNVVKLPVELTKLKRIRHLSVSRNICINPDETIPDFGVKPPKGLWRLRNLHVMQFIDATDDLMQNLGNLVNLRKLQITNFRSEQCSGLFSATSNMNHLTYLFVVAKDGEVLQLTTLNLPESLQKLYIFGKLEKASLTECFTSLQNHKNLRKLILFRSKLEEDSFSYLQELPSLVTFYLLWAYVGHKLCFHETSFPKLQEFSILCAPKLEQIEIKKGAMPNLKRLTLSNCPQLNAPQGIEHLSKLEGFGWTNSDINLRNLVQRGKKDANCSKEHTSILHMINFISRPSDYLESIEDDT
jgi:disease resistance protein RPM1